jgi:nicotinamide-nucleotide amidase
VSVKRRGDPLGKLTLCPRSATPLSCAPPFRRSNPMFPADLIERAAALLDRCRAAGAKIATAESCTGGLVAALLTEIPGSSAVVERGFVVYSNEAKQDLLGVPAETLERHGAVSQATARALAEGALRASRADLAVSVTGVAGPDGGTAAKPVGLVFFAAARAGAATLAREERFGDLGRSNVRLASARVALEMLDKALEGKAPQVRA